jgi:membrane dipeptidase
VPDSILKRLPANGGVVMVTFVAGFTDPAIARIQVPAMMEASRRAQGKSVEESEKIFEEVMGGLKLPKTNIAMVANHIEHIRKVAGVKHIGLGGDYDGNTDWPVGLEDVSGYPLLFAELIRRGWSDADLKLLAGENVLRAFGQAEDVAHQINKKLNKK